LASSLGHAEVPQQALAAGFPHISAGFHRRNVAGAISLAGAKRPVFLSRWGLAPARLDQNLREKESALSMNGTVLGQASRLPLGRLAPESIAGETPAQAAGSV